MYPSIARGHKIPLAREDFRSVPASHMMPKLDGQAAMVVIDGDCCVIVSATHAATFGLPVSINTRIAATAELLTSQHGDNYACITGVVSVGDMLCDPASPNTCLLYTSPSPRD